MFNIFMKHINFDYCWIFFKSNCNIHCKRFTIFCYAYYGYFHFITLKMLIKYSVNLIYYSFNLY